MVKYDFQLMLCIYDVTLREAHSMMEHTQKLNVPVNLHNSITAEVNLPLLPEKKTIIHFCIYLVKHLMRNGYQRYHLTILTNTSPCIGLV
jgi:hypothetical protein